MTHYEVKYKKRWFNLKFNFMKDAKRFVIDLIKLGGLLPKSFNIKIKQ